VKSCSGIRSALVLLFYDMQPSRQFVLIVESHVDEIYTRARRNADISASNLLFARTLDSAFYLSKTFRPYRIIVSDSLAQRDIALVFRFLRVGNPQASVLVMTPGPLASILGPTSPHAC
jgi:hypothetical protein